METNQISSVEGTNSILSFVETNPILSGVLAFFFLFIVGISTVAIIFIQRKDPNYPWVDTIIEMLPVIGLLGTFVGAFIALFAGNTHGFKGVIVAFSISALGWLFYLVLQSIRTHYTADDGHLQNQLWVDPSAMVDGMDNLYENTKNTFVALSNVEKKLDGIDVTLKSITEKTKKINITQFQNQLVELNQLVAGTGDKLNEIETALNGIAVLTEKDMSIEINDSSDYETITKKLGALVRNLNKLNSTQKEHAINIAFPENMKEDVETLDTTSGILANISAHLDSINAVAKKRLSVQLETPGSLVTTSDELARLSATLQNLDTAPKKQVIEISHLNNLEISSEALGSMAGGLGEIQQCLDRLKGSPQEYGLSFRLPEKTDETINRLERIRDAVNTLPTDKKKYDYTISLKIKDFPGLTYIRKLFASKKR